MKIATEYLQAYSAKDFDKMASFYSDSSFFADYTAMDAFRNDNRKVGVEIYRREKDFVIRVDFDVIAYNGCVKVVAF